MSSCATSSAALPGRSPFRPDRIASCHSTCIAGTGSTSPASARHACASRCTNPRRAVWCWRAIHSASSRSTTPKARRASPLHPSPQALIEAGLVAPRLLQRARDELVANADSDRPRDDLCRHQPGTAGRDCDRLPRADGRAPRRAALPECGPVALDEDEALRSSMLRSPTA